MLLKFVVCLYRLPLSCIKIIVLNIFGVSLQNQLYYFSKKFGLLNIQDS